jgi:uncharacterized protein (TIGR02757 family)
VTRALAKVLDTVLAERDKTGARIDGDPVRIVRRFADPRDQEVAGLIASAMAYGRVSLFLPILERLFERLGPSPARAVRDLARGPRARAEKLTTDLSYRMTRPRDLADLLRVLGRGADREGGLEALFLEGDDPSEPDLALALARFRDTLLAQAPKDVEPGRIGIVRLLPDVAKGSATKRLWLFLRWMVRRDDVDVGAWPRVAKERLLIPLDAHIFRFSKALGLTRRSAPDVKASREVTRALKVLDPEDPVRYDFALCHLGMEEGCREERFDPVCRPCPLRPACVLYNGTRKRT